MTIETIRADFELLDTWEDRYRYVIELGRALPPMPPQLKTDENKVRGCASQVWLASRPSSTRVGALQFEGDSDAHIVKGLVAILFALYQDRTPPEILDVDADAAFASLGLKEHLTPQRSNGLASMVLRIRADAARARG
ncbi:MAG: SufE family protein [Gammaproteobacteria bacterium]|nr:SufE family protein [Gammaproteobacteria bacterium]